MAVASRLVYSSSDVIGDIHIVPISNLTSAQLLRAQSPVAASAAALGAEIPPSPPYICSLRCFTGLWRWVNKGRQRVLSVQVLFWAENSHVRTGIVCRSRPRSPRGSRHLPSVQGHGRSRHRRVALRDMKEQRNLTCLLHLPYKCSLLDT